MDRNAPCCHRITPAAIVALRKESVDRNILGVSIVSKQPVALRKESVDRNIVLIPSIMTVRLVALRKESVDRNL